MNDRLGDLPAWAQDSDSEEDDVEQQRATTSSQQQPKHMEHFFREVESIKADIEAVKRATKSIGETNEAVLQATTTEDENKLSGKLRPLIDKTNNQAKRTKNLLGLLKEETQKLKDEGKIKQSDLRCAPTKWDNF